MLFAVRALNGVIQIDSSFDDFKSHALIFDKLFIHSDPLEYLRWGQAPRLRHAAEGDYEYLQEKGFVHRLEPDLMARASRSWAEEMFGSGNEFGGTTASFVAAMPSNVRNLARTISEATGVHTVPVYDHEPPVGLESSLREQIATTLSVGLSLMPVPGPCESWEDIMRFRDESHDKKWEFRRLLNRLATTKQNESEIRDDMEWSLNEYAKAMAIHKIKASQSFIDVFLVSPLEIIENLVTLNWSKIAKGMLQVRKRKVELLEAEMKAPGRECAYVFDARNRFG